MNSIFKWSGILISILLVGIAFLCAAQWLEGDIPSYDSREFSQAQFEAVLSLEKGASYERKGEFDQALEEYQKALDVKSDKVSREARLATERITTKKNNPWWSFRLNLRNFLIDFVQYLMWLTVFGIVALLLWQLLQWIPRRPGIELQSFDVVADSEKTEKIHERFQQAIIDTLRGAQVAHRTANQSFSTLAEQITLPSISLPHAEQKALGNALQQLGSIQVAGVAKVDIQALLTFAKRLTDRRQHVLRGTLRRLGKGWTVTAELTQADRGKIIHRWEMSDLPLHSQDEESDTHNTNETTKDGQKSNTKSEITSEDSIFELGRGLAYRMQYDLLGDRNVPLESRSWESFKHLTEGLRALQRSQMGAADRGSLEEAVDHFEKTVSIDPCHELANFYLGLVCSILGENQRASAVFGEILKSGDQWRGELTSQILKGIKQSQISRSAKWFFRHELRAIMKYLQSGDEASARRILEKLNWPMILPKPKDKVGLYLWTLCQVNRGVLYFEAKYHQAVANLRQLDEEGSENAQHLFSELEDILHDNPGSLSQTRQDILKSLTRCGWINACVQTCLYGDKPDIIKQITMKAITKEILKRHIEEIRTLIAHENPEVAAAACNALGLWAIIIRESNLQEKSGLMDPQAYFYHSLDLMPYWPDTYVYLAWATEEKRWMDAALKLNPNYEYEKYAEQLYSLADKTKDLNYKLKLLNILVEMDSEFTANEECPSIDEFKKDTSIELERE
jgi:tetratricopeptide (TPR) repeat protein